jgi:hypothetical protein
MVQNRKEELEEIWYTGMPGKRSSRVVPAYHASFPKITPFGDDQVNRVKEVMVFSVDPEHIPRIPDRPVCLLTRYAPILHVSNEVICDKST